MNNPISEEWRTIPGWEGAYEASSLGRVRSLERITYDANGNPHRTMPRIMRQQDRAGYKHLALSHGPKRRTGWVHQLVALAFIGEPPDGLEVCHGDGNPGNNTPGNLRYGTRADNAADREKHGTQHQLNWTHCPHGHEYTPENILMKDGSRRCLTCHRCRSRETNRRRSGYYERRGEAPPPSFAEAVKTYTPRRPVKDRSIASNRAHDLKLGQNMGKDDSAA